nr:hypothetical protein [Tanacetum cinerariifolium]
MTFEEIEAKFTTVWKQLEDFNPIGSKEEAERFKRKGLNLEQESVKKLRTSEEVPEEVKSPDEVELKRLYEPDDEDQLWTHTQNLMHAQVEWKLYDTCGVHHVTSKNREIFMLVEKDYPLRKGLAIMMICYKLQVENYSQMANDLIMKIYKIANYPKKGSYCCEDCNATKVKKKLQMRGSEYGEQDRKATILYEYETFKATEEEQLLDTYLHYLQVINDLKKCGYKKDNYPLALVTDKTKVSKRKEKVVVSSNFEGSGANDFSELKKITALLAKAFNRRKFYSKPTNNNLRTSSTSQSTNKKQEFVKSNDTKVEKKDDEKKQDMSKVKCYNCKKEGHFAKDCKKAKVKDYN